jgi:hypothetical protein
MTKFKKWIKENYDLKELKDIATHGCISACPNGLIFYHESCKAYDLYEEEIWDYLYEMKESFGHKSILEMICSFNDAKDIQSDAQFKNLLVWVYVEEMARTLIKEC